MDDKGGVAEFESVIVYGQSRQDGDQVFGVHPLEKQTEGSDKWDRKFFSRGPKYVHMINKYNDNINSLERPQEYQSCARSF